MKLLIGSDVSLLRSTILKILSLGGLFESIPQSDGFLVPSARNVAW